MWIDEGAALQMADAVDLVVERLIAPSPAASDDRP